MTSMLTAPLCIAKAFSPGHITGFIEKPEKISNNNSNNHLYVGSKGAGFSINRGITTTVKIFDHDSVNYQISINGIRVQDAEVSKWVIEEYLKLIDQRCYINIEHESTIPIGFGLGSSGAAALSLSYALNNAFNIGLSTLEAAQIAHNAEIACKTGLGTVLAEFTGGFEIRTNAGAPGIGTIEKIELKNHKAIILCISQISTKSFLSKNHTVLANGLGKKMLKNLKASKDAHNFLKMSYCFANYLGLTEGKCKMPIQRLKSRGIDPGVALFGETLFTLVPSDQIEEAKECLKNFEGNLIICDIDNVGARMLQVE
jgi:pantoate kinase